MYKLVHGFFYIISLLPLRILYLLSDILFLLLYWIVGYRKKVVKSNLSKSFPEKSVRELKRIEKSFYRWLCDYFVESFKLISMPREEVRKRLVLQNTEELEECFKEGQSVAVVLGHYCNWEWLSCTPLYISEDIKSGLIYHPLRNKVFDKLFIELRSHNDGVVVPKRDILRYLIDYNYKDIKSIFGYIADQGPTYENIHLWINFMNQETGVFTGGERIMRKMNNAVFYAQMSRPKRGYYTCTFKLITKTPNDLPEHEITKRFFSMLEDMIRKEPRYYLWTHNRWKRTHEEFDRRYIVDAHGHIVARHKESIAKKD